MVFSSLEFICLFLPISLLAYYLTKSIKLKNIILLILSILCYSFAQPIYVILMLFSTVFIWYITLKIQQAKDNNEYLKAKKLMWLSFVITILPLLIFKYTNFLILNINLIFSLNINKVNLTLPLGISFYSFKLIGYLIDIYKGKYTCERNIVHFALFICCFAQFLQGPITRYDELKQQIQQREIDYSNIVDGLTRFLIGCVKKVLIADKLSSIVTYLLKDGIANTPVLILWLAMFAFALQIYYDFSGYSDMAIGLSAMFNFTIKENFNYPYLSKSTAEFWRRWHISLGNFFKDYLYIPLGGNRKHQIFNLLIVWLLTGLWHGAEFNFILWGLYFFILQLIERFIFKNKIQSITFISNILTIIALVVGWEIFYFTDINQTIFGLKTMFMLNDVPLYSNNYTAYIINNLPIYIISLVFCYPFATKLKEELAKAKQTAPNLWFACKIIIIVVCLYISIVCLIGSGLSTFLYANF